MTRNPLLTDDEVWQPDGHLSEIALTALGDGERALLPEAALRHVDVCDSCTARLGEQALLSISLGEALTAAPARARVRATAPARFPVAALVVALVLAGIGALPAVLEAPSWLTSLPAALIQGVPVAFRAALALLKVASTDSLLVVAVTLAAAVVLCAIGFSIARLAPRQMAWKGVQK
jgi:hypothetical protein